MRRSTDRILVSHAGTLPRPDDIARLFNASSGNGVDDEFQNLLPEAVNPMHEWEWHVWEEAKLPDGKSLMPGVVGHATNVIEHPETVADRLVNYARVVGRENVIAGTDCGIGTRVGHGEIAWAKLQSMVEGARIATRRLWGAR